MKTTSSFLAAMVASFSLVCAAAAGMSTSTAANGETGTADTGGSVRGVELHELKDSFNASTGSVRVVTILSPTCSECRSGHAVVKTVFDQTDARDLKGFVIWLPMLQEDDLDAATAQSTAFRDGRVREGWDPERHVGDVFTKTLKLHRTAWDVYMVYDRHVRWEGTEPPVPSFWMHQLTQDAGADQRFCLDPKRLSREVLKRLRMR